MFLTAYGQATMRSSIRCSESDADYSKLRALSYNAFVVYVGGIPLLILGGMLWSRRKLNVIHEASNMPDITPDGFGDVERHCQGNPADN